MQSRNVAAILAAAVVGVTVGLVWRPRYAAHEATPQVATAPETIGARDAGDDTYALPDFDAEVAMYDQPQLVNEALEKVTPQTPGSVDLYVIVFAGDGSQNVFRNEAEYAQHLFERRFDAAGHVIVLENNPAMVASRPLATLTNLIWVLDAFAAKMDRKEDVLLLYLTSHGSEDHELLVDLDPLPLDQITPADLADALHTDPPVHWKIVVVNACYSGGFIDALRSDSTMIITSARADRPSFGCGDDSDITWFGKAFLVQALNRTTSLRAAFDIAKRSIAEWETVAHDEPSEPQIASAPAIDAQLARWRAQLKPGPAVEFTPIARKASDPVGGAPAARN
ncbi:MAG: C13 family peptidase [Rhodanobacteraceae bacterium]